MGKINVGKIKTMVIVLTSILSFTLLFLMPKKVYASSSWADITSDAQKFIEVGTENPHDLDVSSAVNSFASILTTIGVIIVLGGLLITGIKYMTATPQEASKLKNKIVGLVVAGIIIIGAFGIWTMTGNIMEGIAAGNGV